MPRVARAYRQALCYHVFNRGLNRQVIFRDDRDREHFSKVVLRYKTECKAKVYHWAWMGTHYHMLVEVPFEHLRAFAGGIQQAYAYYHHARHGTSGTFWQGRFRSEPVEIGDYLTRCGRYIERNPVRGGVIDVAWKYPWSSAAFYVEGVTDGLTDANTHVAAEGMTPRDRDLYGSALISTDDDEWMHQQRQGRVIGGKGFGARVKTQGGRHRKKHGRPANVR
jgi:putative transposase